MNDFRADLHIHTVLSPCGDLEMSPSCIVERALQKGLDIIGITDHNATGNAGVTKWLGERKGLFVMTGAEVTTKEEVHCLVFFENSDTLKRFQQFIDLNLPFVRNSNTLFGDQLEVDEDENIIRTEDRLLTTALQKSIDEVEIFVHTLGGLFIPAHADRNRNSVYSQLGMLPPLLQADAVELSRRCDTQSFLSQHPELNSVSRIRSSDAHYPDDIGCAVSHFRIEKPDFGEIRMAIQRLKGRYIEDL